MKATLYTEKLLELGLRKINVISSNWYVNMFLEFELMKVRCIFKLNLNEEKRLSLY